jgi:hypothetical protein
MSEFDELPPLRKKTTSGQVQVRRARTAEQIQRARKDGHENLLKRAIIGNRSSPDYVVSEVIVFMMRDTKKHNNRRLFDKYFWILSQRVQRSFRWYVPGGAGTRDSDQLKMEEMVIDKLNVLISKDMEGYDERLDYYEVSFDQALMYDRKDAWRSVMGKAKRRVSMTNGDEDERLTPEVKLALTDMANDNFAESEKRNYLLRCLAAIKELPDKEREVMMLSLREIPDESTDPSVPSISSILNCTPKTVRSRRKSAQIKMKTLLGEEE